MNKQILLLVILIAIALPLGGKAYREYRAFQVADEAYRQGDNRLFHGAWETAIPEFRRAVNAYPGHQGAWLGLVEAQLDGEQYDEALASAEEALKHFPQSALLYRLQAAGYKGKRNQPARIAALEKAVQLGSDDPMNRNLLERARKEGGAEPTPSQGASPSK